MDVPSLHCLELAPYRGGADGGTKAPMNGFASATDGANASPAIADAPQPRNRVASLGDHHVRRLDHCKGLVADLESEIVDRLIGNRRRDDHPTTDVDADMRRRLTFG